MGDVGCGLQCQMACPHRAILHVLLSSFLILLVSDTADPKACIFNVNVLPI